METSAKDILCQIKKNNLDLLYKKYDPKLIKKVGLIVGEEENLEELIRNCLNLIYLNKSKRNQNVEWNISGILSYIDPYQIIKILKNYEKLDELKDSLGIAWLIGELHVKDFFLQKILLNMINFSNHSDVWWQAAFSLEQIGFIENAINFLKKDVQGTKKQDIDYYIKNIEDKKSLIYLLLLSDKKVIENKIFPSIKEIALSINTDTNILINCFWLIGRFGLMDNDVIIRANELLENEDRYPVIHTILTSLIQNPNNIKINTIFNKFLKDKNPLIRKLCARGIAKQGLTEFLGTLEERLVIEDDESTIKELCRSIYILKNPEIKRLNKIAKDFSEIEKGTILDKTNKWYTNPYLYDSFSMAVDPEEIIFNLVKSILSERKINIKNPVDLGVGTGRLLKFILNSIDFQGIAYGVDNSPEMISYLNKSLAVTRYTTKKMCVLQDSLEKFKINGKSNLMISSFGFPSKIFDKNIALTELKNVYSQLDNNGLLITIGWDETFNDEFSTMWFKYLYDDSTKKNFEEWRRERIKTIKSPRNCNLTWYKKNLVVPIQFPSLEETARIIGALFGRDSLIEIIRKKKTFWEVSMGITLNTKKDIKKIIKIMENERS